VVVRPAQVVHAAVHVKVTLAAMRADKVSHAVAIVRLGLITRRVALSQTR